MPQTTTDAAADQIAIKLLSTPEGRRNPYPLYHELRALDPVHRSELGMWLLTRYDDIAAITRDPRFGKDFGKQMSTTIGPQRHTQGSQKPGSFATTASCSTHSAASLMRW